jgi:predicted nucleic acid-binding protein
MLRVALNSSVLVSGFLTEGGTTATLLSHYREKRFLLCTSPWIIEETQRALQRPRNLNRYLVTGDDEMIVLAEHLGIGIVTLRQFLDLIGSF